MLALPVWAECIKAHQMRTKYTKIPIKLFHQIREGNTFSNFYLIFSQKNNHP